jgi:hypothetical protein
MENAKMERGGSLVARCAQHLYSSGPLPEKQSFHDEAHRGVNENLHVGNSVHQHVEISAVGEARRILSLCLWSHCG